MSGVGLMTALCSVSLCSVGHRLLATIIDQVITAHLVEQKLLLLLENFKRCLTLSSRVCLECIKPGAVKRRA